MRRKAWFAALGDLQKHGIDIEGKMVLIKLFVPEDQKDAFERLLPAEDQRGGSACASTSTNGALATGLDFIKGHTSPRTVFAPAVPGIPPPALRASPLNCLGVPHLRLRMCR
jgi:hypothetical protein